MTENVEQQELSAGEVIAAFIGKRLEDNLAAFREYLPEVYEMFKEYQEQRYFLIYDAEGNINVLDRDSGELQFGSNPVQEVMDNLDRYLANPVMRPYYMVGSQESETNPVHNRCLKAIGEVQQGILGKMNLGKLAISLPDDAGIPTVEYFQPYSVALPEQINSFFVLSIGLGFDIEHLYLNRDIRKLCIVEPEPDIFYCSMQLMDWASIIEKSVEKNFKIYIGISEDQDKLVKDVAGYITRSGRHNAAGSYIYSAFYKEEYEAVFKDFKSEMDLGLLTGYGFYDDSRLSLAHTYHNFRNGVPCIRSNRSVNKKFGQENVPIFVVGSGPSLDDDLAFIKENSDKAIIISSGSALRTLYLNGITPDFHSELERTAHVPVCLKASADGDEFFEYLKKIRLVGMSQLHPEAYKLFGMAGQMPKDTETGSLAIRRLFSDEGVALISRAAGSCLHVAFTFAVLAGFKDIYFFGADMGSKYLDRHHSKGSMYDEMNEKSLERYKIKEKNTVEFDANFGDDKVYSYSYLPMFKRILEGNINGWNSNFQGTLNINNCSDGALIKGADPIRSCDLELSDIDLDISKSDMADGIMTSYFSFYPEEKDAEQIAEFISDSLPKIEAMCEWLKAHISEVESVFEAADVVDNLSYQFHANLEDIGLEIDDSWLYSLFDGTLLYVLSAIQSTLFLPISEEKRVDAFNNIIPALHQLCDDIVDEMTSDPFKTDQEEFYTLFDK